MTPMRRIKFLAVLYSCVSPFYWGFYDYTQYIGNHFHNNHDAAVEVYKTSLLFAIGYSTFQKMDFYGTKQFFQRFRKIFLNGR